MPSPLIAPETPEAVASRRWIGLAVGSLILAGLLSLLLVIARAPVFSGLVQDPAFFRRCLVVHVDLSLLVWLYSFAAALSFLLVRQGQSSLASRGSPFVAATGVLLLLLAAGAPGAEPVLANYVPMIDHWLFSAGLVVFASGVLLAVVDRRLLPSTPAPGSLLPAPDAVVPALRATGVALILAALTFAASWAVTPAGLPVDRLFELTNWAGGHVLQLASTIAMIAAWLVLLGGVLGQSPVSRRTVAVVVGLMVLPWMAAPVWASRGVQDIGARAVFTQLMRWCIFPGGLALLIGCLAALARAQREGRLDRTARRDPRLIGFCASAALTSLGWVLGSLIHGSTTMIPAHYHAAIGGVTVAFMATCYPLADALGLPTKKTARTARLVFWQPAVFAAGQAIFATGFAIAGAGGMGRKVYGAEQQLRGPMHTIGMAVMGIGGLVAICGGLLFLALVVLAWLRRERTTTHVWVMTPPEPGGTHG